MKEALKLALEELAVRFSEGWHEGIKIDASDIMLLNEAAQALAQPAQEPVAWKNAAIRLGEELSSVGPDGYYDMAAKQWLDWAMEQEPQGKNSLAQPAPPPECKTEAEQTAYAFGWWKALESVRTEPDWKDQYEKQKRRAEMWIAKYEKDIGSLEKAAPIAQEPRNFCPRCGKRTADLTVIHTCTPPRGLEMT